MLECDVTHYEHYIREGYSWHPTCVTDSDGLVALGCCAGLVKLSMQDAHLGHATSGPTPQAGAVTQALAAKLYVLLMLCMVESLLSSDVYAEYWS